METDKKAESVQCVAVGPEAIILGLCLLTTGQSSSGWGLGENMTGRTLGERAERACAESQGFLFCVVTPFDHAQASAKQEVSEKEPALPGSPQGSSLRPACWALLR